MAFCRDQQDMWQEFKQTGHMIFKQCNLHSRWISREFVLHRSLPPMEMTMMFIRLLSRQLSIPWPLMNLPTSPLEHCWAEGRGMNRMYVQHNQVITISRSWRKVKPRLSRSASCHNWRGSLPNVKPKQLQERTPELIARLTLMSWPEPEMLPGFSLFSFVKCRFLKFIC